jgi:hypothetical protein
MSLIRVTSACGPVQIVYISSSASTMVCSKCVKMTGEIHAGTLELLAVSDPALLGAATVFDANDVRNRLMVDFVSVS